MSICGIRDDRPYSIQYTIQGIMSFVMLLCNVGKTNQYAGDGDKILDCRIAVATNRKEVDLERNAD